MQGAYLVSPSESKSLTCRTDQPLKKPPLSHFTTQSRRFKGCLDMSKSYSDMCNNTAMTSHPIDVCIHSFRSKLMNKNKL
ncbi:unnamed protein product [Jaminaea pallidilutea]